MLNILGVHPHERIISVGGLPGTAVSVFTLQKCTAVGTSEQAVL